MSRGRGRGRQVSLIPHQKFQAVNDKGCHDCRPQPVSVVVSALLHPAHRPVCATSGSWPGLGPGIPLVNSFWGHAQGMDRGRRGMRRPWNGPDDRLGSDESLSVEELVQLIQVQCASQTSVQ